MAMLYGGRGGGSRGPSTQHDALTPYIIEIDTPYIETIPYLHIRLTAIPLTLFSLNFACTHTTPCYRAERPA